ncbi:hypothetical protein ACFLSE_09930 [Bacteroidota bacterium]
MVQISEEVWKEILNNQKFPLIGSNKPNDGNGFNDAISWKIKFRPFKRPDKIYNSSFFNVYLRDLGLNLKPNLKKETFEKGFRIENCSKNYYDTFLKYFNNDTYYHRNEIFRELGHWGEYLGRHGRVIFEIISWYDNKSSQFYGFELNRLDTEHCKIKGKNIIYYAPYELNNNKEVFKKVKIPKSKCIIIDFPEELGGYKGFQRKIKNILKLGEHHIFTDNPAENVSHFKRWDKEFNRIVSEWGIYNNQDNVTDYYKVLSRFKFTYMVILCTHEIIKGFTQLIKFLNKQLQEDAKVIFEAEQYEISSYKRMLQKWLNGELSFNEAFEYMRL